MGLGDILGSISPAYGAITGKGLGGLARNLSPLYLLFHGLGGGGDDQPQKAPVAGQMPVNTGMSGPAASLPGISPARAAPPSIGGKPNILQSLGTALQSNSSQDQGIAQAPQLMPQGNGLGAILAQILSSM